MPLFEHLAEQKIAEAVARGELDDLPGSGRPLDLDDDALVPEDLRLACRILKNAGLVPPEVEALRQLRDLERCMATMEDQDERTTAVRKLDWLRACLEARGGGALLAPGRPYVDRILQRLGGHG
jgi:hypothetical protein